MELKNTLKIIGISLLGVLGVGLSTISGAYGMMMINTYQCASAYSVNENQESVTFTKNELNDCIYEYLATKLSQLSENPLLNSYVVYNNITYTYNNEESDITDTINWSNNTNSISFDVGAEMRFAYNGGSNFTYGMTIYSSWFAQNMQKSVTLSASQLNNITYEYLANIFDSGEYDDEYLGYIIYNNNIYNYVEGSYDNDYLQFKYDDEYIVFSFTGGNAGKFVLNNTGDSSSTYTFNNSITIYSTYIADNLYAPYQPSSLLEIIVGLLTGGITGIASGVGTGVSTLTTQIFINGNALSVFGGILVVFAGLSLAIGLSRWIMRFLTSLGAKK